VGWLELVAWLSWLASYVFGIWVAERYKGGWFRVLVVFTGIALVFVLYFWFVWVLGLWLVLGIGVAVMAALIVANRRLNRRYAMPPLPEIGNFGR
jgi:hypothetical protein